MEKRKLLLNIDNKKHLDFNYKEIDYDNYLDVTVNLNINCKELLDTPTIKLNTDIVNNREIYLSGNYLLILSYIMKNPELKKYKLILNDEFDLNTSIEKLEYLNDLYKDLNNIYIKGKYNVEYVTIKEYIKTIKAINSIVNKIKSYNLSPLEQILYVYDFVRQKEYKAENINESVFLSRDLSKVLFNDKIVCTGYSILFNAILEKLNINSNSYYYKNINKKHKKHENNVVQIEDDKYNIHGLYYFDLTGDRCLGNEDYLNSYLFFAKTKENFDDFFKGTHRDNSLKGYNLHRLRLLKIIKHLSSKDEFSLYLINSFLNIYDEEEFFQLNKEERINLLYDSYKILNKPINHKKLIDALYNVRRIKFYEKGKKIDFTKQDLLEIAYNSEWINNSKRGK